MRAQRGWMMRSARIGAPLAAAALLSACAGHQSPVTAGNGLTASQEAAIYKARAKPSYAPPGPPTDPWGPYIQEASQRFDVPDAWIRGVMRVESGGYQFRASGELTTSPVGAMGLMQLMPETWAALRARHGLGHDAFDPHDNILAGAAFLREMHDRYGSPGFLAAYNAGPGRYEDYRDRQRPLPAETVAYVAALAPFVGDGVTDGPVLVAASDPSSWTQAPLFITQWASIEPADRATTKPQSNDTSAVVAVRDLSTIAPQSGGLFVAVSASGPQR